MFQVKDLEEFSLFDPQKDGQEKITDIPGNYVILLRKGSKLPNGGVAYIPSMVMYGGEEYELIYVGISNESLRSRDYKKHFNGNNAGQSTLRKSLGSLMGMTKTYRSPGEKSKVNPKTKFVKEDEEKLSEWMKENLILLFKANDDCRPLELEMISVLTPPLNIQDNSHVGNMDFRNNLTRLRNDLSKLK